MVIHSRNGVSDHAFSFVKTREEQRFLYNYLRKRTSAEERKIVMSLTRKILKGMGLTEEQVDSIIDMHTETVNGLKAEIAAVQEADKPAEAPNIKETQEYKDMEKRLADKEKEYGDLQTKLADRDYTDAVRSAIAGANGGKGVKFSSKSAEKAFLAELKSNPLEMKDGALTGFEDYLKNQMATDPDAFQSSDPPPRFSGHIGAGGAPNAAPPNVTMAKAMGAAKAATIKAANDVFANYT